MDDLEILDEIASLEFVRIQKVTELFNSTLVFTCYVKDYKRLYLVFDHNAQTRSFHFQANRPHGFKTKSLFTLLLNKYVVGKHVKFFRLQHTHAVRANFVHDDVSYALIFEIKPTFSLGLIRDDVMMASFKKNIVPTIDHESQPSPQTMHGLQKNFERAKEHEKKFLSFHHTALFNQQLEGMKRELKKAQKLLENVKGDRKKCETNLALESDAELLRANLHRVKRGMKSIDVVDYLQDPPTERTIQIDSTVNPKEFLERTFAKVKRAKRGLAIIDTRINQIENTIEALRRAVDDFIADGVLRIDITQPGEQEPRKKVGKRLPYRIYYSIDKTPILVGRSAKDSDHLTLHYAKGNDWWFHAKNVPGAHVIARTSGHELSSDTLIDAALLAAHFSNERTSHRASVLYTRVKYVRKPKGLGVGKVLVSQEKTIEIAMDKQRLARILSPHHIEH